MRSDLKRRAEKRERKTGNFSGRLTAVGTPYGAASEAYRTLRTNLLYARVDTPPRVVVVTGPGPGEGKSTVCANLGAVLAQASRETLIVDCDFRNPVMHRVFGAEDARGIVDVLMEDVPPEEVCREVLPGLKLAPVGTLPPNPAELLGSLRFSEFLAQVRREFDYVLLDAPPLVGFSDSLTLATQGDGVLLVFDAQNTRKGAVRQAMRSLQAVGADTLGTVMNNVKGPKPGQYWNYAG